MSMPDRLSVRPGVRGGLVLALLAATILALRGGALLYEHSLNSLDGAMQTWFALHHFAAGDRLGSAFQSYLGITMVLSLLPVFAALGQTLFASTMAAYAMVTAGAFAAAWAVVGMIRAVPARQRWQAAVVLLFAFYYAGPMAAGVAGPAWPATLDPGVSLRPLRGFLPFLVLPFYLVLVRAVLREGRALPGGLLLGLVAGAGLLWSNDAGIPLVIALTAGLALALHHRPGLLARTLAAFGAGTAASAGAILLAVTHGAPGPWVAYNFRDVAGDQFWFFAPWERSTRILGPADLPNILRHADPLSAASLVVLAACVLWAALQRLRARSAPVRGSAFVFVGASVLGTALVPQLGGHVGPEYNPITFVLGACAPLIVGGRALLRRDKPWLRRAAAGPGLIAGLAALGMIGIEAVHLATVWSATDRTVYDPALGFHVTPAEARDLAAMRRLNAAWEAEGVPADRRLLSVYTSTLDIAAGVESPAAVGSLIHALGPRNRAAFTALVAERKVAAVTTIAPDSSGWEGWLLRADWPFFRALRTNYTPIARSRQQVLWVRREVAAPRPSPAKCRVLTPTGGTLVLEVDAPAAGLAALTVTRRPPFATGRGAMLTVTEASPDTLGPAEDRWTDFPRYAVRNAATLALVAPVEPGTPTRLTLEQLDGAALGAATCTAEVHPAIAFAALPPLAEGIARYLEAGR
ncbi:hypothetical protein ACLBKU_00935 [Erythrobacter sp. NE805]|uniref:hypothetical protein n=1 Tax=Erythrobacter sp. NE805 TaxID=3389875 RepID=UPI00396B20E4